MKKKRCRHCKGLFLPDARNQDRQKYCGRSECRAASKVASRKKWLNRPENQDYFKGPEQVERVREWRKKTPDYWKRSKRQIALQDSLTVQPAETIENNAQIANSALQDDIALTLLRMQQSGQDILCLQPKIRGKDDCKNSDFKQPYPQGPQELQLGRSPAYPGPAY